MNTQIIKNPRVTEKGSYAAERNVYTFDITAGVSKAEIRKAIFELYKVRPVKINVLAVPDKKIMLRGRPGTKSGGRKALIYLKKGDTIEFI